MGCCFEGERVDAGDKVGYIKANLLEALSRDELSRPVLEMMRSLIKDADA